MPNHKFVTETFDCSKKDLPGRLETYKLDIMLKNGGDAPGTLAATTGLMISDVNSFAERDAAEMAISVRTSPGGEPLAVRLAQADPETGSQINHRTGERRMVWLVGAKCLTAPPSRRTGFR